MEPLYVALGLVLVVVAGMVSAFVGGWSARDKSADAELALVRRDLDIAADAIEVLQEDAKRQSFASAGLVKAARSLASARRVADPRERRRLLLGAPPAPPSPGPGPTSGPAA